MLPMLEVRVKAEINGHCKTEKRSNAEKKNVLKKRKQNLFKIYFRRQNTKSVLSSTVSRPDRVKHEENKKERESERERKRPATAVRKV